MTGKLLARDQKKGKETISSILCLVHDDFWGSHSRVFCNIKTLSIHVALIPQEFEVLHKPFNSYCHLGCLEGDRKQGQHLACFLAGGHSFGWNRRPSEEEGGRKQTQGVSGCINRLTVFPSTGLMLGVQPLQLPTMLGLSLVHHLFTSLQCGVGVGA